jgi:hypothetical protein
VDWLAMLTARVAPAPLDAGAEASAIAIAIAAAAVLVVLRPTWRVVRLGVTLVHELGHAAVGVAVGRRFVGFVVRGDMSGHAVTAGPSRGIGRVLSTWAGYPAPALVGASLVWMALRGWAAPVTSALLLSGLLVAVRVRSAFTALVLGGVLAVTAAVWWWRDDAIQLQAMLAVGLLLLVGAWRHVIAVIRTGSRSDDPAVLAQLSGVPRMLWNLSFLGVATVASWLVLTSLLDVVPAGGPG